jgi:hypothetical protein
VATDSSETVLTRPTQRYIQEEGIPYCHCHKNLRVHIACTVYLTSNMSQELLSYHVIIIWQSREICPIKERAQLIGIYTFG